MDHPHETGLSVIIPSWNTIELTRNCLASLLRTDHRLDLEVVVVDNGSQDGSPEMIGREFPEVKLLRNETNQYYSKANNQGVELATKPFLCLLNSDTVIPPGSLSALVGYLAEHPDCGAVAPRLNNPDGSIQPICRRFPTLLDVVVDQFDFNIRYLQNHKHRQSMADFDHLSPRDVDQPPGTCLVLRRDLFVALNGFDENMPLFYSDVDLCLRIWKTGKRIRYMPEAPIFHVGSASVLIHPLWRTRFIGDQVRYLRKHKGRVAGWGAKSLIGLAASYHGARTLLGRQERQKKREILKQIYGTSKTAFLA